MLHIHLRLGFSNAIMYLISITVHHLFWLIVINLCFWMIYRANHPFFERFKSNEDPWPWQEDPNEWKIFLRKTLIMVAFNSLVTLPVFVLFFFHLDNYNLNYRFDLESIPNTSTLIAQLLLFAVMEDFGFHLIHRLLHTKYLYPYIHKMHHQYKVTVSISSEYSHPVEYILTSILTSSIAIILMGSRVHASSNFVWNFLRTLEAADGHSGYDFPWSPFRILPFGNSVSYHDFHHHNNVGNYSSLFHIWDTVFGTNKVYNAYLKKKD